MAVLIIGSAERARIAEMIAYAIPLETLREGQVPDRKVVELKDRQPGFERPPSQHIVFPGDYRAALSMEVQPAGLCSHLSISTVTGRLHNPGMLPSPEAVKMIADAFGVPFPAGITAWMEEFDPGEYAINLLSLVEPNPQQEQIP